MLQIRIQRYGKTKIQPFGAAPTRGARFSIGCEEALSKPIADLNVHLAWQAAPADLETVDGVGEWDTATISHGRGHRIEFLRTLHFPHSLGLLYSAVTAFCGFKVNSGEYKVMGLAPYGEPRFKGLILDKIVDLKEDGTFRLDQSYFDYCTGLRMTNDKFADVFGINASASGNSREKNGSKGKKSTHGLTPELSRAEGVGLND